MSEVSSVGVLDRVGEVAVEDEKEADDVRPGPAIVALHVNPFDLLISGEGEPRGELKADNAVEIVVAGIDKVADSLLAAPFAATEWFSSDFGRDGR